MKFRLTFAFLILGFVLAFLGGKGLVTSFLPAKYIYDQNLDWTKLRNGQRVYADVDFVFEPFEITSDDSGKDVSAIYTIPDLKSDENGNVYVAHYMGILVKSEDFSKYDRMVDASWNWWDDTTGEVEWAAAGVDSFDGYLRKMDKKEQEFIHDYLKDWYSESEIQDMVVPYVMMRSQSMIANILMFGGGIILIVIGAIFGVLFFIKKPAGI